MLKANPRRLNSSSNSIRAFMRIKPHGDEAEFTKADNTRPPGPWHPTTTDERVLGLALSRLQHRRHHLRRLRLLASQTVQRPQPQHQIHAMDANHLPIRK